MVGRGRHRSPADRARTLAAIEIDILVGFDLVRAVVRRHPACSGEASSRAPLDGDGSDQIDVAEHPDSLACIWTIAVAFIGAAGVIIDQYRLPFWIGTAMLVVSLIHHRPKPTTLLVPLAATAVVMLPWLSHGISTHPGSIFWDGWWYLAVGETIKDHSRSALMPPDASPMYELGFSSLPERFITPALIAMFQGVVLRPGETQATIGFLLFFYVFVLACSIGALGAGAVSRRCPAARLGYIAAATISGFRYHDAACEQHRSVVCHGRTSARSSDSVYAGMGGPQELPSQPGAVCAALVLIYPELSPATVGIPSLILMWRLWDERPDAGQVAITVGFGSACMGRIARPRAAPESLALFSGIRLSWFLRQKPQRARAKVTFQHS